MNDAEYVLKQTNTERKRVGRGAFAKKNGSKSKKCTLPSEYLTRKERKMLDGKVQTYNMSAPVPWREFKREWPRDLQVEYLTRLEETYNARTPEIAKMFGIAPGTLQVFRKSLGIEWKRG